MKMTLCKNSFALCPPGCSNASGSIKQLCLSHMHHHFPGIMSACNTDGNHVYMLHRREPHLHAAQTGTASACCRPRLEPRLYAAQTGTASACCTDGNCVCMLQTCCRHRQEPRLHAADTDGNRVRMLQTQMHAQPRVSRLAQAGSHFQELLSLLHAPSCSCYPETHCPEHVLVQILSQMHRKAEVRVSGCPSLHFQALSWPSDDALGFPIAEIFVGASQSVHKYVCLPLPSRLLRGPSIYSSTLPLSARAA